MKLLKRTKSTIQVIGKIKNWRKYLFEYVGRLDSKRTLCRLRNGLKVIYRKNISDKIIVNDVFVYEYYFRHYDIKPEDVVVDVGGHIGLFTVYAGYKAKKGKIFTFEPIKENYELLKKNVELNNLKNIVATNKAVAKSEGTTSFYINTQNVGASSLYMKKGKKITIKTVSLVKFLSAKKIKTVDYLKLDCEGGEYEIIKSLKKSKILFKKIVLEYHPLDDKRNEKSLIKDLVDMNYKVIIERKSAMIHACKKK